MKGLKQPDLSCARSLLRAPGLSPATQGLLNRLERPRDSPPAPGGSNDEERIRLLRSEDPASSVPTLSELHQIILKRKRAAPWRARPVGPDTRYEVRSTSVALTQPPTPSDTLWSGTHSPPARWSPACGRHRSRSAFPGRRGGPRCRGASSR